MFTSHLALSDIRALQHDATISVSDSCPLSFKRHSILPDTTWSAVAQVRAQADSLGRRACLPGRRICCTADLAGADSGRTFDSHCTPSSTLVTQ